MESADSGASSHEHCPSQYSPMYPTENIQTYCRRHKLVNIHEVNLDAHKVVAPKDDHECQNENMNHDRDTTTNNEREQTRAQLVPEGVGQTNYEVTAALALQAVPLDSVENHQLLQVIVKPVDHGHQHLGAPAEAVDMISKHKLAMNADERHELTRSQLQLAQLQHLHSLLAKVEAQLQQLIAKAVHELPDVANHEGKQESLESENMGKHVQQPDETHPIDHPKYDHYTKTQLRSSLMRDCARVWNTIVKHPNSWLFLEPVGANALNLPDYHIIISKPMDLGTIKRKFQNKEYTSPLQFAEDVRLTFANAIKYNPREKDAHVMARNSSRRFEREWRRLSPKLKRLADFEDGEVVQTEYHLSDISTIPQASADAGTPPRQVQIPSQGIDIINAYVSRSSSNLRPYVTSNTALKSEGLEDLTKMIENYLQQTDQIRSVIEFLNGRNAHMKLENPER